MGAPVLVESGICSGDSIEQVMAGKHYNRALRVHKIVFEGLERLLLEVFERRYGGELDEQSKESFGRLSADPSEENLLNVVSNESCVEFLNRYAKFEEEAYDGKLGKTTQFRLRYMEKVWLMLRFLRATKENNLELHIATLEQMTSNFFALDHPNYARYTAVYLLMLMNLEESHPGAKQLISRNGFSVNRSSVPVAKVLLTSHSSNSTIIVRSPDTDVLLANPEKQNK